MNGLTCHHPPSPCPTWATLATFTHPCPPLPNLVQSVPPLPTQPPWPTWAALVPLLPPCPPLPNLDHPLTTLAPHGPPWFNPQPAFTHIVCVNLHRINGVPRPKASLAHFPHSPPHTLQACLTLPRLTIPHQTASGVWWGEGSKQWFRSDGPYARGRVREPSTGAPSHPLHQGAGLTLCISRTFWGSSHTSSQTLPAPSGSVSYTSHTLYIHCTLGGTSQLYFLRHSLGARVIRCVGYTIFLRRHPALPRQRQREWGGGGGGGRGGGGRGRVPA